MYHLNILDNTCNNDTEFNDELKMKKVGNMITEEKWIKTHDSYQLNLQIHENGSPSWIILIHGLGEYGQRHKHLYKLFSQSFNICTFDLRGHGKSSGKRGYVKHFSQYLDDLELILNFLKNKYFMKRYTLIGHSMGGLILSSFMQNRAQKDFYPEKVILSSPACSPTGLLGHIIRACSTSILDKLSLIPFSLPIKGALDIKKLSHDRRVYENYIKDPLNTLKIHTHLFFEVLSESRRVFSKPLGVDCQLYVAIGTADHLVDSTFCIDYFQSVESVNSLYIADQGYHELHNEVQRISKPYLQFLHDAVVKKDNEKL